MLAIALGSTEIILIVAVLFLLFGASRLPQLAKSLGQSRKAFKEGLREAELEEEAEKQKIAAASSPSVNEIKDDRAVDEIRRQSEAKQV